MNVSFATAQGSGTNNEDWTGASRSVAVVLDGITTPPGMDDTGCTHGTPWLVTTLGTSLLVSAERHPTTTITDALHDAILSTASQHSATCDLDAPGTPSAAVAMIRTTTTTLDYLVLSDAFVVLDTERDIQVITDLRGQDLVAAQRAATFAHPIGTEGHTTNRRAMVDLQRSYRNAPGGYWVAAGKPDAARHAVVGQTRLGEVRRAAVLSDGAAALIEYGLSDWKGLLDMLEHDGPARLIDRVREAERSDPHGIRWPRFKPSDDAAAILCTF
jgi:hypothetical protein